MALERDAADLSGRVAVVTGAAQGIGRAIAETFANFGADVALCDRDVEGLAGAAAAIDATGRRVSTAELDVRDADGVQAWADGVARDLGPVDVLVNNAGGGFVSPFLDVRPKGITALVDENFSSVVHCIRAFVPSMNDGGSIINITSIEAFRAAPNYSVYAAMKAAVEQLTRTLALELGPRAIRVNCIAPDAIATPGVSALQAGGDAGASDQIADMFVPLGKGRPDDCAGAAVFLASALSRFVTGSTVHVDGGTLAAAGWRRDADGTWNL